jgi:hypothetical protein
MFVRGRILISDLKLKVFIVTVLYLVNVYSQDIVNIRYDNFKDVSDWQLNARAVALRNNLNEQVIRLTNAETYIHGTAFIKEKIKLDRKSDGKISFNSHFACRILDSGGSGDNDGDGGDGIVFVLQNVASDVKSARTGIGYNEIRNSIGIEFDTYRNNESGVKDRDGNHIGINTNGSAESKKSIYIPTRFCHRIWYVWLNYDGNKKILDIRFNTVNKKPDTPTVIDTLDIFNFLQSTEAYVGFTAATGGGYSKHDIVSFAISNEYIPEYLDLSIDASKTIAKPGDTIKLASIISDNNSNLYSDISQSTSWRIIDGDGNSNQTINKIMGDTIIFSPEVAFSKVVIEARADVKTSYLDTCLLDTITIDINSGIPNILSLESDSVLSNVTSLRNTHYVKNITFQPNVNNKKLYAVLRDQSGAFCRYVDFNELQWNILDNSFLSIIPDTENKYQNVIKRIGRNGGTAIVASWNGITSNTVSVVLESDRDFKLIYNNNEVITLNEDMDSLSILFDPGKSTLSEVAFYVSTRNNVVPDSEVVTLKKNMFYWEGNTVSSFNLTTNLFDSIIQNNYEDTICFSFKNTTNPEDVFIVMYPFKVKNALAANQAVCFDKDADGYADNVQIKFNGIIDTSELQNIYNLIQLPSELPFTVKSLSSSGNTLILTGCGPENGLPNTSVSQNAVITITNSKLKNGDFIKSAMLPLMDSMAPVIIDAVVYSSETDSVKITFSENIDTIQSNEPFLFRNSESVEFSVKIINSQIYKNIYTGILYSVNNRIDNNDSIMINSHAAIRDTNRNVQSCSLNRIVPIKLFRGSIKFLSAAFYDADANGMIDSVVFNYSGKINPKDHDTIISAINFPNDRKLIPDKWIFENKKVSVTVKEARNGNPQTSILSSDNIIVNQKDLTDNGAVFASVINVEDKMPPVLISASALYSVDDLFNCEFSEPVYITDNNAFVFKKKNSVSYKIDLEKKRDLKKFFSLNIITPRDISNLADGDSVSINTDVSLSDGTSNRQLNKQNRKVGLKLAVTKFPHLVAVKTVNNPSRGQNIEIFAEITTKNKQIGTFTGELSIYDGLKKPVLTNAKMTFWKSQRYVHFSWNCKNGTGRKVGSGTYLAVVTIKDADGNSFTKKEYLGVQGL